MTTPIKHISTLTAAAACLALFAGSVHAQSTSEATEGKSTAGETLEKLTKKMGEAEEKTPVDATAGTRTTGDYATKYKEAGQSGQAVPEDLVAEIQKMGGTSEGRNVGEAEASKVRPGFKGEWSDTNQSAVDAHARNVLRNAK